MRVVLSTMVLTAVLACGSNVWGRPANEPGPLPNAPKEPPPIEVGAATFAQMDFGLICQRDSDVTGCTDLATFVGFALAPRWRISSAFSLGVLGAVGWEVSGLSINGGSDGSRQDPRLMEWRLEAEGRWHPLRTAGVDPWLGVDMGFLAIIDTLSEYGAGGRFTGSASATQFGPVAGAALGVDFPATSFLAFGLEFRAGVRSFGHHPPMLDVGQHIEAHDFGTLAAGSLALSGTFLATP